MDMTGERRIAATRAVVWAALNDTALLKAAIPGCQELERLDNDRMRAVAAVKVGPVTARFTGMVSLLDLNPPESYRIEGEGQGGVAGFAKGGAIVRLTEAGDDTILHYEVKAQVGGKLAQLGARLIDATAKQLSDAFFTRFAAGLDAQHVGVTEQATPAAANAPATIGMGSLVPQKVWIGAGVTALLGVIGFLLLRRKSPGARAYHAIPGEPGPVVIDRDILHDLTLLQQMRTIRRS
jgi:carbon monoxide dehydrogenase subunit G